MNFADKIRAATGRKVVSFPVPQWGFDVSIRSWSPAELQAFIDKAEEPGIDLFAWVAVRSLCDDAGNLLFTDDDIPVLTQKDFDVLHLIADEVKKLNRMGSVETAKKN